MAICTGERGNAVCKWCDYFFALVSFFRESVLRFLFPPSSPNISHSQFLSLLYPKKNIIVVDGGGRAPAWFQRWIYARDVGMQGVSCNFFFCVFFLIRPCTLFLLLFYDWCVAIPLLLSHPETCGDMAGSSFLLVGSTVAICVVSGAAEDGYD